MGRTPTKREVLTPKRELTYDHSGDSEQPTPLGSERVSGLELRA